MNRTIRISTLAYLATFLAPLAALPTRSSAETPVITISKSDTLSVALQPISGSDGTACTGAIRRDLDLSGRFAIVEAQKAGFTIAGAASGGRLDARVTDPAGRVVLSNGYSGSPRAAAHAFVDDLLETLTGEKGIATTKIAFVSNRTGRKEIYTCDYDGANMQQLTRDNAISVSPAISPDASTIAYTGYQSGYADVYAIELGSGRRQRIIKFPGTNSGAAFSPDGNRIALTMSKDGNPEIYTCSVGGGSPRRLTRSRGVESSPTWSPDGGEIIYASDDRGTPQLYRMSSGGGAARPLPSGHGYCTEPCWSPDGRQIAFTVRSGGFQIAVMDLGGGGSRIVASGEDPSWGANSRHLVYAEGGSLIVLDTRAGKKTPIVSGMGKVSEPSWSRD
jgi:TolB protein